VGELGVVAGVVNILGGSALAAPAAPGALVLAVADTSDFQTAGATLDIGPGLEQVPYVGVDDATGLVSLGQAINGTYDEGTTVNVQPDAVTRVAHVLVDDLPGGDALVARIPHALYPLLREGTRDVNEREPVVVDFDGADWVVTDVVAVRPTLDQLPVGSDGAFIVLDANGEIQGQLGGLSMGFDELHVGTLNSESIVSAGPLGAVTLYVNPTTGSDDYDGLLPAYDPVSGSGPTATIQAAIDSIPRFIQGDYVISCATGLYYEPLALLGFMGAGSVTIDGQDKTLTTLFGAVDIESCRCDTTLQNFRVDDDGSGNGAGTVYARDSGFVLVTNVDARANSLRAYAIRASASVMQVDTSSAFGGTSGAMQAQSGSIMRIFNCTGTGGIVCQWSIMFLTGTQPSGGTTSQNSGQIFGSYSGSSGSSGTSGSNKTKYWNASPSGSWRNSFGGGWRSDNDYAYEGDYGAGNHRGCYFYDWSDIRTTLSGKTLKSASIYLVRRSEGGVSAPVSIALGTHDLGAKSGVPATDAVGGVGSLAWGGAKWIGGGQVLTLVTRIRNATGNAKGIVAYQGDGSPYAILQGVRESGSAGKLKVTYQ
jgi:hypothetical protein